MGAAVMGRFGDYFAPSWGEVCPLDSSLGGGLRRRSTERRDAAPCPTLRRAGSRCTKGGCMSWV